MRLIALIIVLLLIAVIPVSVSDAQLNVDSGNMEYYNFTTLAPGISPASNSNFSFSTLGVESHFSSNISGGSGYNGLDVSAQHYQEWSFLNASIASLYRDRNISVTYSWNNLESAGYTDNFIVFSYGGKVMLNVSFGPDDDANWSASISWPNGSAYLGPEPAMDTIFIMSLLIPHNSSVIYFQLCGDNSGTISLPVSLSSITAGTGNINLMVGGQYCNVTLYNISENGRIPANIYETVHGDSFSDKSSPVSNEVKMFQNFSGQQIILRNINSVLYADSNGSIWDMNYYNVTPEKICGIPSGSHPKWISDALLGSVAYFVTSYGQNFSVFDFHSASYSSQCYSFEHALRGDFELQALNGTLLILGVSGIITAVNTTTMDSAQSINLSSLSGMSDLELLGGFVSGTQYSASYYSRNAMEVCNFTISLKDYSLQSTRKDQLSLYDGPLRNLTYADEGHSLASMFIISRVNSQAFFSTGKMKLIPFTGFYKTFDAALESSYIVGEKSRYYILESNRTSARTNVNFIEGQTIWFAGTYAVTWYGRVLSVFNRTGIDPYSPYSLSAIMSPDYNLRNSAFINVTVNSELPYLLLLNFDNSTYYLKNSSSLFLNSTKDLNGKYELSGYAKNIAGYNVSFTSIVYVDNGHPGLNCSLDGSDYITNTTEIAYSSNWSIGIKRIQVCYLNRSIALNGNTGYFMADTGNYSGTMEIDFIITDDFGRIFSYNYSETVIWNNPSNRSLNIWNGEYVNQSNLNLKWSPLSYVSHYVVYIKSGQDSLRYNVFSDTYAIYLKNGNYSISVRAVLDDNSTVLIGEGNITVMTYAPSISIKQTGDSYYSFFGNSSNSTFFCNITTNVSALLGIRIYSPGNNEIEELYAYDCFNISILRYNTSFSSNGKYKIVIESTGSSRLTSKVSLNLFVNNSIPQNPVNNGESIYTNRSFFFLPYLNGISYGLEYTYRGNTLETGIGSNGSVGLNYGTGVYSFSLSMYSKSMNFNVSRFKVYYFTEAPAIAYNVSSLTLINSSNLTFRVSISDPVGMRNVSVNYGNTINQNATDSYMNPLVLEFFRDGNVTVRISATDLCGNSNSSSFKVDVQYYPELYSLSINLHNFFLFQQFSANLNGVKTYCLTENWFVDGNPIDQGSPHIYSLPLGFSNLSVSVTIGGKTIMKHEEVFSTGPYLSAGTVLAVLGLYSFIRFGGSDDTESVTELLLKCSGLKIDAIMKLSRKRHFKVSAVKKRIEEMVDQKQAEYGLDPDGKRYFKLIRKGK